MNKGKKKYNIYEMDRDYGGKVRNGRLRHKIMIKTRRSGKESKESKPQPCNRDIK